MADPSTPPPSRIQPTTAQVLVTLLGGVALALGGCAGVWATRVEVAPIFAIAFIIGLVSIGVGVVLLIVRLVRLARQRRGSNTIGTSEG